MSHDEDELLSVNRACVSTNQQYPESAELIYWTDAMAGASKIRTSNLDGSDVRDLIELRKGNFVWASAIAVTDDFVYWTTVDSSVGNSTISRATLDGDDVVELVTGLGYALDLAVTAESIYWTDVAAGNVPAKTLQKSNLDGTKIVDVVAVSDGAAPHVFTVIIPEPTAIGQSILLAVATVFAVHKHRGRKLSHV